MARFKDKERKKTVSKCPFCGGKLEEKTITHPQAYRGKIYILENVPAEVCPQCGEVLLHPEVLKKIQQLVWSEIAPRHTREVPVYDLAEVG